ncbi:hypothetical protein [Colwellia psychrerythraea]|uniref:Uncharacterized protein n=1 Tax=Colwellia psychrerythraea TaxID=28229 RepID=A0A099KL76_COLPS|nr:hypothetical protein [Colwellia psychrerythraea]KGJ91171.1 hypothetical protein GAB14E_3323 [Colwellia psychrerythraea]
MSDPVFYSDITTLSGDIVSVKYRQEVCQGGPTIGRLFIGDKLILPSMYFGGPFLVKDRCLYIPVRKKSIFFNGFVLTEVNLDTFDLRALKAKSDVINLKSIDNENIYFSRSYFGDEKVESIKRM